MDALYDWAMSQGDSLVLWAYLALFAVIAVGAIMTGLIRQVWNAIKHYFRRYVRRVVREELDDR